MTPHLERLDSFYISGLTEQTCIAAERDPASARVEQLWLRFFEEDAYERPQRTPDPRLFGVYTRRGAAGPGSFEVTAGVAVHEGTPLVQVEGGEYLVFSGRGPMPALVHALWQEADAYFERHPELRRRFRSDFEAYSGPEQVALHIGVERAPVAV
ncbi:GyrI-like domain-containing protein [Variovorax sp.]|uniref:GyrI-like domain-containing protein n=1 Tax=Variovorax sp. TaxID=1871043 RepID=UPI002D379239|nr:GyrI-like domain-containing protein [Variovorax sp.]HYP81718.1 GyrI-like domain-containing protein [Variovorax sp.]